ncbi:MAG: hypothetical protein ACOC6D_05305 [Atribacterota bacterium]
MFGEKIGPNKGMPKGLSLEEKKDWVAEKLYESMYTREIIDIGYKELSQKDIEAKKQNIDLTKEYPLEINALFEIGTNTATLLYFSDELKDLGVNTYFVHAEIQIKDGKLKIFQPAYSQKGLLSQEEAKRVIIDRILMAKQNGFSVGFVTDLPDVSFGIGRENYDIKTLNPQYEKLVLEWAKIAEEYGVEYFVPINEYEVLLSVNGYSLEEVYQYTNDFYEDIIPKIREVYNGKIIIKSGGMDSWSDHLGFSKKGADLFGFGPWYACNTDEIKRRTKELVEVADEISIRDGVPWLVTEYYIATQEDIDEDVDESFSERGVAIPMGDAYRAGLSEIKKSKENVGFTFTGYIGRGKIRGTEAVLILKDYFNE